MEKKVNTVPTPRFVRAGVAAEMIGLAEQTLAQRRCRGDGPPFIKLGGAVRYDLRDLETWMLSHRRTSTSDRGDAA
jgi:hypothetical protein